MSHLIEFQLITNENVQFTFDQLHNIAIPLTQLNKLTLNRKQWISNDQGSVQSNELHMLVDQFLPKLDYFHCYIKINSSISQIINFT